MNFSPKDLIKVLESKGFRLKKITSSHHIYVHPELKIRVVVPVHGNKDIPKGTFFSILKEAGISKEEI
jgi:predicted RNA binding protein YcfA (HicA-like mRNA interferase family)